MPDDFLLSDAPVPLPVGGTPAPPAPPQPQAGGWKAAAPLLALLPVAMKQGGQAAVAALLRGYQEAQAQSGEVAAQRYGQQRQGWMDQRTQAQDAAAEQFRTQQLGNQRTTAEAAQLNAQRQMLDDFMTRAAGMETPEQATAAAQLYPGLDPSAVQGFIGATFTPTRKQKSDAKRVVEAITKGHPAQTLNQLVQAGAKFPGPTGEQLTLPEWEYRATFGEQGPAMPTPKADPATPGSFEDYVVKFATELGKTPDQLTTGELQQARKEYQQADDRPRVSVNLSGMNPRQVTTFNQIAGAYQRSPLILASDRTLVLDDTIQAVRKDPTDSANQLSLAYGFIQILDSYQSAVREGELQLARGTASILDQLKMQAGRITTGALIPPSTALQMADSSERMIAAIKDGKRRKQQEFASRARVSGVGEMWDEFVRGAEAPMAPATPAAPTDGRATVTPATGGPVAPPAGGNPFRGRGAGSGR